MLIVERQAFQELDWFFSTRTTTVFRDGNRWFSGMGLDFRFRSVQRIRKKMKLTDIGFNLEILSDIG